MQSQKYNIIHQCNLCTSTEAQRFFSSSSYLPLNTTHKSTGALQQLMTATAVCSLQLSGSYSCIMRLVIYCYRKTLKRHRKKLPLGCVLPKTLQRETLLCQPGESIPKTWGWPGCSPTLGVTKRIHSSARLQHTGALYEKANLIPRELLFTWMPPL